MPNFNNNIEDYKRFKDAGKIVEIRAVESNPEQREVVYQVADELGNVSEAKQIINVEYQKKLLENLESAPSDLQIKFKGLYQELINDCTTAESLKT